MSNKIAQKKYLKPIFPHNFSKILIYFSSKEAFFFCGLPSINLKLFSKEPRYQNCFATYVENLQELLHIL